MSKVDFSKVDKRLAKLGVKKEAFTPNPAAMAPQGPPQGAVPPGAPQGGPQGPAAGAPAGPAPMPPPGAGAPVPGGMGGPMPPGADGQSVTVPEGAVMLKAEDLKDLLREVAGNGGSSSSGSEGGSDSSSTEVEELSSRVKTLEAQLSELMSMLQVLGPAMQGGAPQGGPPAGPPGGPPQGGAPEGPPPLEVPTHGMNPEDRQNVGMIQDLMEGG